MAATAKSLTGPRRFFRLSLERVYWFWMNLPHPAIDHPFTEAVRETTFGFLSVTGWLGLLLAIRQKIPGVSLFAAAFLLIPVILLALAAIIWVYSPEHARKELDAISV